MVPVGMCKPSAPDAPASKSKGPSGRDGGLAESIKVCREYKAHEIALSREPQERNAMIQSVSRCWLLEPRPTRASARASLLSASGVEGESCADSLVILAKGAREPQKGAREPSTCEPSTRLACAREGCERRVP